MTTPLGEIIASRRAPVATKSWTVRASVDDTSAMSGRCSPSSHVAAPGVPSSSGVKRSSQRTMPNVPSAEGFWASVRTTVVVV